MYRLFQKTYSSTKLGCKWRRSCRAPPGRRRRQHDSPTHGRASQCISADRHDVSQRPVCQCTWSHSPRWAL